VIELSAARAPDGYVIMRNGVDRRSAVAQECKSAGSRWRGSVKESAEKKGTIGVGRPTPGLVDANSQSSQNQLLLHPFRENPKAPATKSVLMIYGR
jgi:hypothetical protein